MVCLFSLLLAIQASIFFYKAQLTDLLIYYIHDLSVIVGEGGGGRGDGIAATESFRLTNNM